MVADPRAYLWRNIGALMGQEKPTLDAVLKKAKLGRGTLQRIRDGDAAVRISSLLAVAEAFGVEVWQLLLPDLDAKTMPAAHMALTADERDLILTLRSRKTSPTRPQRTVDLPSLPAGVVLIPERRSPAGKEVAGYPNDRRKAKPQEGIDAARTKPIAKTRRIR